MTIKNPFLEKTFIALRPNFFPDLQTEHITMRYYNAIRWDVLLQDLARMEKHLPATIEPVIYSSWKSNVDSKTFNGLLVECKGSPILDHLEMPHITIPSGWDTKALVANLEPQVVDTLWIGKKINGQLMWAKYNSKSLGANYEQFAEFPAGHELIPPYYQPTALPS